MAVLILFLSMLLIIGVLAVIVIKITGLHYNVNMLSKANFLLFILISLFSGFYPYEGIGTALETASFCLMLGFLVVTIWRILFKESDIKLWLMGWGGLSGLYLISGIVKYSQDGAIKNIVDFGMMLLPSITVLVIVSMVKKNDYGRVLSKLLGVTYILFSIFFSIMPPNDLGTVLVSMIMMLLFGGVCGIGLFIAYRKIYSPVNDIYGMMDEQ